MGVFDDLLGSNGVIEQLLLWNVIGQVISNMMSPAFNALQQDTLKAHPNMVITPDILARAVTQTFMSKADASTEAAKSGLDGTRFGVLLDLAAVRLQPADLAEAVLRSYLTKGDAEEQAKLQGVTADRFTTMTLLAGDGIGPEQAAEALRRNYIKRDGTGPTSTSYEQAIAESRLHNKWADVLYELTNAILSPPDAAEAVVRGFMPVDKALALVALSGVDESQFAVMTNLAADAPSPTALAEALRRDIIPYDSKSGDKPGFLQGIQQGRLADKWVPMMRALSLEWPTPTDALEARLVGQVTTDESQKLYAKFGGDPQYFDLLFHTRGESPTPLELIQLANRGVIPWNGTGTNKTTYEQGFDEGRWRDKWKPVYKKLAEYLPDVGIVMELLASGSIDDSYAAELLAKWGLDTRLITAYIHQAHTNALSEYRGETVEMILKSYYEQIITKEEATPILESLHVTPEAMKLMFEYQDLQRDFTAINGAVTRIRTLYAGRKITAATAKTSLITIGIKADAISGMLAAWQLENSIEVKQLTVTQITAAFVAEIITYSEALVELNNIGYTAYDAWVLLSSAAGAPLKDKPPQGPPKLQDQPIPGTT
jgi:hypothetical protein